MTVDAEAAALVADIDARARRQVTPSGARCSVPAAERSHGALEAVLARLVDVVRDHTLAASLKAHRRVQRVRALEARVGPQQEAADSLRPAPGEHGLDQRPAGASAAERGVEIEPMQLRRAGVETLDADGADDPAAVTDDEERSPRRPVMLLEAQQVGNFRGGIVDEAVLRVDPTDQRDDLGRVTRRRGRRRPRADRQLLAPVESPTV
jgi:hypothetical protein